MLIGKDAHLIDGMPLEIRTSHYNYHQCNVCCERKLVLFFNYQEKKKGSQMINNKNVI